MEIGFLTLLRYSAYNSAWSATSSRETCSPFPLHLEHEYFPKWTAQVLKFRILKGPESAEEPAAAGRMAWTLRPSPSGATRAAPALQLDSPRTAKSLARVRKVHESLTATLRVAMQRVLRRNVRSEKTRCR